MVWYCVQGAIQGPGEFAEGLMLGVRSLVGHTVGGAAGAVSRITGAMGHGLAALSLDKVLLAYFCILYTFIGHTCTRIRTPQSNTKTKDLYCSIFVCIEIKTIGPISKNLAKL